MDLNLRTVTYPSLTQDEDLRAGFHCGHAVGGDALPRTLVVLHQRLQEQGTIGQYGVRCATHQVDLRGIKRNDAQFLQIIRFLILGLCSHKLSAQVDLKIINVRFFRIQVQAAGFWNTLPPKLRFINQLSFSRTTAQNLLECLTFRIRLNFSTHN